MATKQVKPFGLGGRSVAVSSYKAPGRLEAAKAERVTVRHNTSGTWVATRVFNTAYYDKKELDRLVKQEMAALRKQGKKGVEAHRFTPTVFNAQGE
jgi:hypothetical protein